MTPNVGGHCDPEFDPVRVAFSEGFTSGREVGAGLSVWYRGRPVVDIYAGFTDRKQTQLWQADTLACVFSVSKAITATCVLQALDETASPDLDQPVVEYWPGFAAAASSKATSKATITLRHLLSHQAGLPAFTQPVEAATLYDWAKVCDALEETLPWWTPGQQHGYHARTFGFLLGEVLRRTTGLLPGEWLAKRICGPRAWDVYLGLPAALHRRCATLLPAKVRLGESRQRPAAARRMMADFGDPSTITGATFQNPNLGPGYMNQAAFRSAQMPALSGHGTASGIAQFMAEVPQLVGADTLSEATAVHSHGRDQVLKSVTRFGLGYMLHDDQAPLGWPGCFGHAGAGGSIAFCDPHKRLGFAFVMNQMQEGVVTGGTTAQHCIGQLEKIVGA